MGMLLVSSLLCVFVSYQFPEVVSAKAEKAQELTTDGRRWSFPRSVLFPQDSNSLVSTVDPDERRWQRPMDRPDDGDYMDKRADQNQNAEKEEPLTAKLLTPRSLDADDGDGDKLQTMRLVLRRGRKAVHHVLLHRQTDLSDEDPDMDLYDFNDDDKQYVIIYLPYYNREEYKRQLKRFKDDSDNYTLTTRHTKQEFYITKPDAEVQVAARVERRSTDDGRFAYRLHKDSIAELNGDYFALESLTKSKRTDEGEGHEWSNHYVLKRLTRFTRTARDNMPVDVKKRSKWSIANKELYVRLCLHLDYDEFKASRLHNNIDDSRDYGKTLVNQMQIVYNKMSQFPEFHGYHINIDLVKVSVETNMKADPVKIRSTPHTQAVLQGKVWQSIVSAHDLLTNWTENHLKTSRECDHYALHSGAVPADFEWDKRRNDFRIYKSPRLGVAWNGGTCSKEYPERACSVTSDVGAMSFFILAHELGHSLGADHDQDRPCVSPSGYLMDQFLPSPRTPEQAKPSTCTVQEIYDYIDKVLNKCLHDHPAIKPKTKNGLVEPL